MISIPPFDNGAIHVTRIPPVLFASATTLRGTPGSERGETGAEASEYAPTPAMFFAATLNVYNVPVTRSLIEVEVTLAVSSSATTAQFCPAQACTT